MSQLCLWNNGAPKIVRQNQRVPVPGGKMDIGSRPYPELDLYWYKETTVALGRFQTKGNLVYSKEGDTVTATQEPSYKTPQQIGQALKQDAKRLRDDIMDGGLKFTPDGENYYVVQTDKDSRDNIGNEITYMNDSGDPSIQWRMQSEDPAADDPNPELTMAEFKDMSLAVRALVKACYTRLAQIEGLISLTVVGAKDDAAAVQALLDIDLEAGWPEKYQAEGGR